MELTIMPLKNRKQLNDSFVIIVNQLTFDENKEFFSMLTELNGRKQVISPLTIPPRLRIAARQTGKGWEAVDTDGFGKRLTFLYVRHFRDLTLPESMSKENMAVIAYIDALPDDTPIILYWS